MTTRIGSRLEAYEATPLGVVYVRCPDCDELHYDPRTGICGSCGEDE